MFNQAFDWARVRNTILPYPERALFTSKFLVVLFLYIGGWNHSSAQTPPTTFRLNPSEFVDEEVIKVEIDHGTSTHQATNVLSVTFIYVCDGFTIDGNSNLSVNLTNSWFNTDPSWTATATASTNGDSLTVTLTRTNNVSVEGYGEIAIVEGVIVELDDLVGKREGNPLLILAKVIQNTSKIVGLTLYPNPTSDQITLKVNQPESIWQYSLFDDKGTLLRVMPPTSEPSTTWDISTLPTGLYTLQATGPTRRETVRFLKSR